MEAARLLTLKAAWMADNRLPNSRRHPSPRPRPGGSPTSHPEMRGTGWCPGYGEDELLEKWARDSKILDIFEGTQQIQLLIIARACWARVPAS
jgi:acyl-CoA dehydrogenase